MLTILKLFWSFCLIGFTSFGGLSMIPLISGEMARHDWMTAVEVSDIVAISEMTPDPLGAFVANLGMTERLGYGPAATYQIGAAVAANSSPKVVGVAFTRKKE